VHAHFFDKGTAIVDVTNKEVINCFQDDLCHRCTFEDFGRYHPSCISKLKDMITSCADEEDKANAKYDSNRGKGKNNSGGNNNKDQGARNNNNNNNNDDYLVLIASTSQTTLSRLFNSL
jgi:hypothetical protein